MATQHGDTQCDNRVIHSVATLWYTMWQHGDTHRSNMVRTQCSQCDDCVDLAHFSQCWYLWSSISTAWTHSVAHCVLWCGDTVIHRVFTQFHSVKMSQIHTVVIVWTQCGPEGVPHCDWLSVFFRQGWSITILEAIIKRTLWGNYIFFYSPLPPKKVCKLFCSYFSIYFDRPPCMERYSFIPQSF